MFDQTEQENTLNAYGLTILSSKHKAIRRLKRGQTAPSIHGNKFWGAGYLLMDYLQQNPPVDSTRVMELGCGWGLAGIHCAKHYNSHVVAIDADQAVFPYLNLHAQYNGVDIETRKQLFSTIEAQQLANIDLIIAADICFWDELAETVSQLIDRACSAGVSRIVIADPERPPFFELAQYCMDNHFAELLPWRVDKPKKASGCILLIENA